MLIVNPQSWHSKMYRWWYRQKYGEEPRHSGNLCPYMRAILFWSWMRWLFIGGRVGPVRAPVLSWPLLLASIPIGGGLLFGWWFFAGVMQIYCVLLIVLAMAATVVGIGLVLSDDGLGGAARIRDGCAPFTDLVGSYLRSFHDRVCPEITFKEDA